MVKIKKDSTVIVVTPKGSKNEEFAVTLADSFKDDPLKDMSNIPISLVIASGFLSLLDEYGADSIKREGLDFIRKRHQKEHKGFTVDNLTDKKEKYLDEEKKVVSLEYYKQEMINKEPEPRGAA